MSVDPYNNVAHTPGAAEFPVRWEDEAREYRAIEAALGRARLNQPYGTHPNEKFDLFFPNSARPKGLAVFIHGGYWRRFSRGHFSHFAAGLTGNGWAVAMPGYPLAPEVKIPQITASVAASVTAISALLPRLPISLVGHSAGGHLAVRMLDETLPIPAEVRARFQRVMAISPVTDLRPLLENQINQILALTPAEAEAESPVNQPAPALPVHTIVGKSELPAFRDQARWLAEAWPKSRLTELENAHHFNALNFLTEPEHPLTRWLILDEGAEQPNRPAPSA
ncbi:alpha/beta hydrolase [Vannielia sp.]|uniref:alpha/beta hydrolase n=1 Tax=Vannielia sp. TaxID=2813045 RepID=UPI0026022574|nr:alpha/beta hydrolase [Vannielia sp.]MDF1871173.1 alpha/beta hydrolase [Vannielia sp.]